MGEDADRSFHSGEDRKGGTSASPEADKASLIRRVTLDLTGLLPTPEEVRAFENDTSPNAYEHLVDGLAGAVDIRGAARTLLAGLCAICGHVRTAL